MQTSVLRALEFDRVRLALARQALTPLGRARALALVPDTDPDRVHEQLLLTVEAVRFTDAGSLAISAPESLADILELIEIEDQPLDPIGLLGLCRFLESVTSVVRAVTRPGLTRLSDLVSPAAAFEDETAAVRRAIEASGDVSDRASPALAEIREALARQRARLRATLETLTRGRETAKYLQDQIVTDRNGRYVVVVRAEHRDAIPGIVHDSSVSGASLYVEPLSTVPLNNEVVALALREQAEIRRILRALTNAFRMRGSELAATIDVAGALDELHAKASLARRADGIAPDLTDDGRIEFRGARHPLLIPAVREAVADAPDAVDRVKASVVVQSDLLLIPPASALVISGPNTGGKTVALKATGLLALMAQSGLLIPVEAGSRFTPLRSVFADIGDEQSISASLSTFSAHVANIVAMDRALELPALVLLDEVGSGTDPIEGGALGAAVIDHFRRRGALVMATTHDDALKSYAATTEGVVSAGFGFHPDTYAPTYRLLYGAPGRSLALEIAQRLGLPDDVIADARRRQSGRESQLAAHLSALDRERGAVERDRQQTASERETLEAERARLLQRETRLAEREAVMTRRLDDRLNETLRSARTEVDRIVGTLKEKAQTLAEQAQQRAMKRGPVLTTGEVGHLRSEARAALSKVAEVLPAAPADHPPLTSLPVVGEAVFVATFGAAGIVRGISGKTIDVEVKGKRIRVRLADLRAADDGNEPRGAKSERVRKDRGVAFTSDRSDTDRPARELVVIGATVDEALGRAEKFLDDALLADERTVRVVHGHGTGRLREGLTKFFREHPLVASVGPAPENDGGKAVTIVELKD